MDKKTEIKNNELVIKQIKNQLEYNDAKIPIFEKEIEFFKSIPESQFLSTEPKFNYESEPEYLSLLKEAVILEKVKQLEELKLMNEKMNNDLEVYKKKIEDLKKDNSISG